LKAQSYKTNVRRIVSIVLSILLVISGGISQGFRQDYRIRTIVIDAGHGGHDTGCLGASAKEKVVALEVALKLGRLIEDNFPDIKVVFTRKSDVFIPLHERAAIANHHKADLFICIHCNSGNKAAFGVETFVMGLHKTEENLLVAKRENAAVLLEEDYKKQYEGFDPNSPEANIIFNLYQNQFLNQSLMFASNVQEEVVEYAGRHNRGVKQAGFLVLYKTAMPSVLIETGFLTHETEEKYLLSDKGQHNIATSIFRAFRKYKIDIETPGSADNTKEPEKVEESTVKTPISTTKDSIVKGSEVLVKPDDKTPVKLESGPKQPEPKKETAAKSTTSQETIKENKTPSKSPDIYFTVQVGASQKPELDQSRFSKVTDLHSVKGDDGFTRFNAGFFTNINIAKKRQSELKTSGFNDCFITAYKGNKKISVTEATSIIQKGNP